jgi:hypothetical protein
MSWRLEVATHNNPTYRQYPEAPQSSPSMDLSFTTKGIEDWRDLKGYEMDIELAQPEFLLPDSPAGLYLGYHIFPDLHIVKFGPRNGTTFQVYWQLCAREGEIEPVETVVVNAIVSFAEAVVSFPDVPRSLKQEHGEFTPQEFQNAANAWEPDFNLARQMIGTYFDPSDFGEPKKWMWSLHYPVIARD